LPDLLDRIKNYQDIWRDLRVFSRQWKRVLLPTDSNIEMGASEAIRAALPREITFHHTSPIIPMRAVKNSVERKGMRRANLKDAAAMCETLSYLDERVSEETRESSNHDEMLFVVYCRGRMVRGYAGEGN
jgi:Xaa-Pro aminopeptidase